jgi:hypothetical protein
MEENSLYFHKKNKKESINFQSKILNWGNNIVKKTRNIKNDTENQIINESLENYLLKNSNEKYNEYSIVDKENYQEFIQSSKLVNDNDFQIFEKTVNLGRKKKGSSEKGIHNKYTSDNIIRKCKAVFINKLRNFINNKIKIFYELDGQQLSDSKKLMKMNQQQIINSHVKYNQSFLNRTIKEIFSENISSRCNKYSLEHNKNLINDLLKDKDKTRNIFFKDIFSLTFLDCIKHIRGDKNEECLKGLQNLDEICQNLKTDDEYKESFKTYIIKFESIINNKKSRKLRKNNKESNKC